LFDPVTPPRLFHDIFDDKLPVLGLTGVTNKKVEEKRAKAAKDHYPEPGTIFCRDKVATLSNYTT